MKFIFAVCVMLFSLLVASVVPGIMFLLYNFIDPISTLEKIVLLGIFWFGGGGLAIFGFILAAVILFHGLEAVLGMR